MLYNSVNFCDDLIHRSRHKGKDDNLTKVNLAIVSVYTVISPNKGR